MKELSMNSPHFDTAISVGIYLFGVWLRREAPLVILSLLLASILLAIAFLLAFKIDYQDYDEGARYLSCSLTPATVCLAVLLYKQLELLKHHLATVAGGIVSGVLVNTLNIFVLPKLFGLGHEHHVTLLPKSIITTTGAGVSEEAGGTITLTVVSTVVTGILGNMITDVISKLFRIGESVVRGLALGISAHAIGMVRALEMGKVEGVMSSLAITVAGLLTVVVVPLVSGPI